MKKNIGIFSFLLTVLTISGWLFSYPVSATVNASLLPNAVQQFFDNSGKPLASGTVTTYEVGTNTLKTTWKDSAGAAANTNPIVLNGAGRAIIYGEGLYRQVVKDRNGNLIWDAVTAPGGGGSSPTLIGDGNAVGTVLPWPGFTVPSQYVFAYGQELSRTTYSDLYTAVTQSANVVCSSASNTLTGISDTTQIKIGAAVELASCVVAGTTVTSKTASTVVLSNPSSVSVNAVARFFPWGNGNGSTTFNVPDLRGSTLSGRDNMGGTAANRLVNGSNIGQQLGITISNFSYLNTLPTTTTILTGSSLTYTPPAGATKIFVQMVGAGGGGGAQGTNSGTDGTDTSFGTWTAIHGQKGLRGDAVATGGIGGTSGVNGTGTLIVRIDGANGSDGTAAATGYAGVGGSSFFGGAGAGGSTTGPVRPAKANTGSGGGGGTQAGANNGGGGGGAGEYVEFLVTGTLTPTTYTVGTKGVGGAAGTNAGGDGANGIIKITEFYNTTTAFNLTSTITGSSQLTDTINYIIKTTPDTPISIANVVTALGGMTGAITCGAGLVCASSTISLDNASAISLTNGEASASAIPGMAVYISASATFKLARANGLSTSGVIGIATSTIAPSGAGVVDTSNVITLTTAQWDAVTGGSGGLSFGQLYFLDPTTFGHLTTTAPTTIGQTVIVVGRAISTTQLQINIGAPILL